MFKRLKDERSVIEIFDEIAEKHKYKLAVVSETTSMTYEELKNRSSYVSEFLFNQGVVSEEIVPLIVDRSVESIVNILGILRAGAAYLPLDILLPNERIEYMLSVSKAKVILCRTLEDLKVIERMDLKNIKAIFCDGSEMQEANNLSMRKGNNNLAYVMFTSGSEGVPKGVMIEDKGIIRLVRDTGYFPFGEDLVFLQSGTLCFDASTFDVFGALLNGATLYFTDKNTLLDSELLGDVIRKNSINSMFLTTPLFHQLVNVDITIFETLDNLVVGGDVLYREDAIRIKKCFPKLRFFNAYGPTENTAFSTIYEVTGHESEVIPIGKSIEYSSTYILDNTGKIVSSGGTGELYVGGYGVGRGYIGDEKRTKERFLPDINGDGLMYKTGDIVMESEDGNLVFLGRCDSQVKYRGFRIELAEIQKRIMSNSFIEDCFTICEKVNKEKILAAFVVFKIENSSRENDSLKATKKLRDNLKNSLPEYMVPEKIIPMERLPLNLNGKVDGKALIKKLRSTCSQESNNKYRPVRDEKEEDIFFRILEKNLDGKVDDKDVLYEVGMNSISAIHILSDFKEAGINVSMKNVLSAKTVKELRLLVCDD
ncbi:MAG: amino acid adenylation domain-containing protein [Pseudobutyrivibrio sp.]|nr:amino acid adenylation domain-containing protein [Pseudobutyrivibrio sp.]